MHNKLNQCCFQINVVYITITACNFCVANLDNTIECLIGVHQKGNDTMNSFYKNIECFFRKIHATLLVHLWKGSCQNRERVTDQLFAQRAQI